MRTSKKPTGTLIDLSPLGSTWNRVYVATATLQFTNAILVACGAYQFAGTNAVAVAVGVALGILSFQLLASNLHLMLRQREWMKLADIVSAAIFRIAESRDAVWRVAAQRELAKTKRTLEELGEGVAHYTTAREENVTFASLEAAERTVTAVFHIRSSQSLQFWKEPLKDEYLRLNRATAERLGPGQFVRVFRVPMNAVKVEEVEQLVELFDKQVESGISVWVDLDLMQSHEFKHKTDYLLVDSQRLHVFAPPDKDIRHINVTLLERRGTLPDFDEHEAEIEAVVARAQEWSTSQRDDIISELKRRNDG